MTAEIKECPFCKGTNIKYSFKRSGQYKRRAVFYATLYCNDCHCYGPRVFLKGDDVSWRMSGKRMKDLYDEGEAKATESWNSRGEVDDTPEGIFALLEEMGENG